MAESSWVRLVERKAAIIHDQIAAMRSLALSNEISLDGVDRPYFDLLNQLYREEFPLAHLIDSSDLVARFEGASISERSTPAKLVTSVMLRLQNQIRNIAKAIAGLNSDQRWPDSLDPLLTGVAKGSLVIGISIPSNRDEEFDEGRQRELPALPDPVLDAVREAVGRVAVVSRYVRADRVDDSIEEEVSDPAVRDMILVAASKLAPTPQSQVDRLMLFEPDVSDKEVIPLTAESRKVLRKAVTRPVKVRDSATFTGTVRAIDLDARRLEIRHVKEIDGGSIRCIYPKARIGSESEILDREVRVYGNYEQQTDGTPRLMEAVKLDVVG